MSTQTLRVVVPVIRDRSTSEAREVARKSASERFPHASGLRLVGRHPWADHDTQEYGVDLGGGSVDAAVFEATATPNL